MGSTVTINSPFLAYLSEYYTVFSYDQPGHGLTSEMEVYSMKSFTDVALKVIEHLKLNTDQLTFLGHSMGGRLAAELGHLFPKSRIVLTCPAGVKMVGKRHFAQRFLTTGLG